MGEHGSSVAGRDLSGSRFEHVPLRGAIFRDVDMSGVQIRGALLTGARLRGVVLSDVEIHGAYDNVTINGVEVGPYVQQQLDLRYPDRVMMRPTDPEGFRGAWARLEELWQGTLARARSLPEERLHASVDEEWSFLQTLRHLSFATAAWLHRAVLGQPSPWSSLDLPWDEAPPMPGVPRDREARPSLAEVVALRERRTTDVRSYLATVTVEELGRTTSPIDDAVGFPSTGFPVSECLRVILDEEWEHRLYAERDLDALGADPLTPR
jgi:hypothetical protein